MPVFLLTVSGLVIGLVLAAGSTGAVLGGALGFLLGAHWQTQARLSRLERTLAEVLRERRGAVAAATARPGPLPEPVRPLAGTETSLPGPATVAPHPPPLESTAPPPEPPAPPLPSPLERVLQGIWNYFTGGNLLVRVGVIVLFFGVAFLLRYAAEHVRISIELRLLGVALGGLLMLGLGWRLRSQRFGYGLVLQGGGIGVLYLTVFAAFRLYPILTPGPAFALLVACALLTALIAVAQDSRALAVAGVTGGFLAPVLASTGRGSHVALFSYYLVLNASILAIAWFKAWRSLNVVGFAFTFVIASFWGYRYYQPAYFRTTEPFLILFFLFYVAIAVLFAGRRAFHPRDSIDATLVFGTPLLALALQAALVADDDYGLAWSALALSAFYAGLAWALWHWLGARGGALREAFAAIAIVCATLAIVLGLDARWTSALWALEGAALVWVGCAQRRLAARLFGIVLQGGAGLAWLLDLPWRGEHETAFLNALYLGDLILAVAGGLSGYWLWRYRDALYSWERFFSGLLFGWAALWWLGGGLWEIAAHWALPDRWSAVVLFLAVSALFAHSLAEWTVWPLLRYFALGLLPALVVSLAGLHATVGHPFVRLGAVAWPLALGVHYGMLYRWDRRRIAYPRWLHPSGLWLLTVLLAWESAWAVERLIQGSAIWRYGAWGIVPALVLAGVLAPGRQRELWPLRSHGEVYRGLGAWPLAVYLWLWIVFINLAGPGEPRPLPYLPLLNPLDLSVGLALGVLAVWLRAVRRERLPLPPAPPFEVLPVAFGAIVFLWLNGILLRTLHHWMGIPFTLSAMLDSVLVQAGLTLLWGITGVSLMLISARRRQRRLWLAGAGGLAVVVGKLFLVDLAAVGTVERIVVFLGVGLLLLIVGYFAPVPPRAAESAAG